MSMLRNFMSHKVRSNAGCWTCRLRRKKCDERRPVCDGCGALEITCHFEDEKPEWMDGGPRQKAMADKIKLQVKKQASQRRDRKYMEILRNGTMSAGEEPAAAAELHGQMYVHQGQHQYQAGGQSHVLQGHDGAGASLVSLDKHLTPPSSHTSGASPDEVPWSGQFFEHNQQQQQQQNQLQQQSQNQLDDDDSTLESDVHFVMIYLDYVFPYLFPHYRPPVLAGGRGWVLEKLQSNKTVFHTAISLASYFFGVMLADDDAGHSECVARMGNKLQAQVEKGLRELQREMSSVCNNGFHIRDGLSVMQSITQMVIFELATNNKETWKVHLEAAFALFTKLIPDPAQWTETLHNVSSSRWPPPSLGEQRRPWSTDQAALRFYTANLMLMDVMSSITLERAPRLQRYHDTVIPGVFTKESRTKGQTAGPIFMDEFVGLHNWIVRVIGEVATLDAWKKEQLAGCAGLCQDDLLARAQPLIASITASLPGLEQQADLGRSSSSALANIVEDPFPHMEPVVTEKLEGFHPTMAAHNALWLRATLVYLYTVVHGWQPQHPDIRPHIEGLTCCIDSLPRSSCLRGLVWPFFVAGCLAPAEDEERFRAAARRLGPLQVFGLLKEAFEIMQKVWSSRDQIDESWDFAQCLRILGHRSLLA